MILDPRKIYFSRLREGAIVPSKREEDGAFDIYACFNEDYIVIEPHQTVMIPTGIASAFDPMYVAILKERGSTGTKGIGQRSGVIDSGYRDEWFVPITNHNTTKMFVAKKHAITYKDDTVLIGNENEGHVAFADSCIIYPYEKAITSCIMVEVPKLTTEEISYEELLKFESERGLGKLGSSTK